MTPPACEACLRRTWLIAALAGHIDVAWRRRDGRPLVLALSDEKLLEWVHDGDIARGYEAFDAAAARERASAAGLEAVCRCSAGYPDPLRDLPDPPAVLHVLGELDRLGSAPVAIVGSRRATAYGAECARALGRGLSAAGVTVVSGMALGIDSIAQAGALDGPSSTIAVLAAAAEVPYPARMRRLHEQIAARGAVVSEMPPGFAGHRWCFPARNRIIAALAQGTVVVEGAERSGSLITADFANELGRWVGAIPGPVTSPLSRGPHALIQQGAELIRDTQDVLDTLFGAGTRTAEPPAATATQDLPPEHRRILRRIEDGRGSLAQLVDRVEDATAVAAVLTDLECRGLVRRLWAGRYVRAQA